MTQTQALETFGNRTWNLDVMIEGVRTKKERHDDLEHIVNFLGMDTANMPPATWEYPLADGRGGEGETVVQTYVQSLTTSFAVIDTWPNHWTLTIKSCKQFSAEAVLQELRRLFGESCILDCNIWTLGRVARYPRAFCGGG